MVPPSKRKWRTFPHTSKVSSARPEAYQEEHQSSRFPKILERARPCLQEGRSTCGRTGICSILYLLSSSASYLYSKDDNPTLRECARIWKAAASKVLTANVRYKKHRGASISKTQNTVTSARSFWQHLLLCSKQGRSPEDPWSMCGPYQYCTQMGRQYDMGRREFEPFRSG